MTKKFYIKTHNKTDKKYFGTSNKDNVDKYLGSGLHWKIISKGVYNGV